jgi:DNA-directed RNA polymerase subunit omega
MMIMEDNLNLDGNEQKRPPVMDSKYRMILVAAQRSKQLQRNARPRVGMDPAKHKPTRIALEEVKKEMVNFEITEE